MTKDLQTLGKSGSVCGTLERRKRRLEDIGDRVKGFRDKDHVWEWRFNYTTFLYFRLTLSDNGTQ